MINDFKEKSVGLLDLVDLDFLQEFQDTFAKSVNLASIMVDDVGPITKPSNFTDFCIKYTRGTEEGYKRCNECDIKWGKLAAEKGEPVVYKCHSGLTDFAVPIMLDGKHIASILGGQILTHKPDEEHFKKVAKELGINEDEYIEALRKIKIVPEEQVNAAAKLLFLTANSISEIAHKNLELIKKRQKDDLLNKTINVIRSTFNTEDIKEYLIKTIGEYFDVDRCCFVNYDNISGQFLPIQSEFLKSPKVKSLIGCDVEKEFPEFCNKLRNRKKNIIIRDIEKTITRKNLISHKALNSLLNSNAKSDYALLIQSKDQIIGVLVLHFIQNKKILTSEELSCLRAIQYQVGQAVYQNILIEENKQIAENEQILRQVMLSSTFNFEQVINLIVTETGKLFKADRCFFIGIDPEENENIPIKKYAEYLSSPNILSHTKVPTNKERTGGFIDQNKSNKIICVENINNINLPEASRHMLIDILSVKSYLIVTVKYDEILYGSIVLHYVNDYKKFSPKELDLAEAMANQSANIINQVKTYDKIQKTYKREKILRKIIEITRSSLDEIEIKKTVVQELGKAFKADRCYFRSYNKIQDKFLPPDVEYLASKNVKSLLNIEPHQEGIKYFSNELRKRVQGFYPVIANIEMAKDTPLEIYMKNSDITADYAMPITDSDEGFTWLVLHYSYEDPKLDDDYKKLLETIAFQVDTALKQIKLYNKAKQQIERENLLRNIFGTMRSSLDINVIKNKIVTEIGKSLNMDICFIMIYNQNENYFDIDEHSEYRSSNKEKSFIGENSEAPAFRFFMKSFKKNKEINFADSEEYIVKNNLQDTPEEAFLRDCHIKSSYNVPVYYANTLLGFIITFYTKDYRVLDKNELDFLRTIGTQAGIALHQAKLYKITKVQAEREKAILSNLPFLVWLKDNENKFLAVNETFAKMCGTTVESLVGKTDYDFWPKELAQKYVDDDLDVMTRGKTKSTEEFIQGPDGPRWHETYKTPLFDENGKVIGTTGFSRDITERKEIDRMKSEFVSTVSHELRTPLTSLSGALELVLSGKMGEFSDKVKSLLNMAHNNCFRLINLINDILDIEKIEAGKMDFEIKTLELMPLIDQAIQLNLQYAQKFNLEIKLLEILPNAFVQVDANRLTQVITNLLSNAIKFSEPNAPVEISINKDNNFIRVSVTNYGAEIPQEFKSRIFQKFAQADSSDSRQKGGTGLGLSISKLIVEKMNGRIGFNSENNKTTFYFDLPEFINKQGEDLNEKKCFNM